MAMCEAVPTEVQAPDLLTVGLGQAEVVDVADARQPVDYSVREAATELAADHAPVRRLVARELGLRLVGVDEDVGQRGGAREARHAEGAGRRLGENRTPTFADFQFEFEFLKIGESRRPENQEFKNSRI